MGKKGGVNLGKRKKTPVKSKKGVSTSNEVEDIHEDELIDESGAGMIDLSDLLDMNEQQETLGKQNSRTRQKPNKNSVEGNQHNFDQYAFRDESAFSVDAHDEEIGISDLLQPLDESAAFGGLKKQVSHLDERSSSHKGAVPVPLSQQQKDKIAREVGYKKNKRILAKWVPIVQHHRQAPHLRFPLVQPEQPKASVSSLTDTFEATSTFEESVASILRESGVNEDDLKQYEEQELKKLDKEEAQKRLSELRKLRQLALYRELKNKRWAKIKSKSFRRVRRKAREKERQQMLEAAELDPELAEAMSIKQEKERAEERMQLKHSRGSQWTKRLLQRGLDKATAEEKQSFEDQLKIRDKLRKKMERYDSGSSSDLDDEDPAEIERKLLATGTEISEMLEKDPNVSSHPLMKMKFMQTAIQEQKQEYLKLVRDSIASSSSEAEDADMTAAAGRRTFAAGSAKRGVPTATRSSKPTGHERAAAEEVDLVAAGTPGRKLVLTKPLLDFEVPQDLENDPLFQPDTTEDKFNPYPEPSLPPPTYSSSDEEGNEEASGQDESSEHEIQLIHEVVSSSDESSSTSDDEVEQDEQDDTAAPQTHAPWRPPVTSTVKRDATAPPPTTDGANPWLQSVETLKAKESKSNKRKGIKITEAQLELDPAKALSLTHASAQAQASKPGFHLTSSANAEQLSIIEKAFQAGGDHLVQEFMAEKKAILDKEKAEAERVDDGSLPGWGSWAGDGSEALNKKVKKRRPKDKKAPLEFKSQRRDADLPHVILNHKFDKKAVRYMVPKLSSEVRTSAQHEELLSVPLGPEWNTSKTFFNRNRPEIETKLGTNITPLVVNFQSTAPNEPRSGKRTKHVASKSTRKPPTQKQRVK